MNLHRTLVPLSFFLALACNGDNGDSDEETEFPNISCADVDGECVEYESGDPQALLDGVNTLEADTTVVLGEGTFTLDNAVTIRAEGIRLVGQGMGETVLDFATAEVGANGVDVIGDGFTLEDLTVLDARKDGVRIESSDRIVIRRVETTWTNEDDPQNGAYGLYPVKVSNVLIEDSVATNASDAGIYVGQCQHAIVRNNTASGNVAGLEIENTQYADVYGNTVTNNTGGLFVFDLPGNPIVGRDIVVHDNIITGNNNPNFAPSGTVQAIPAGTGSLFMASRRVEVRNNTYADNGTTDVAIVSGLAIASDPASWALNPTTIVGDWTDLGLMTDPGTGAVFNFRTEEIWVHDNTHSGSGTLVDAGAIDSDCLVNPSGAACTRPLGVLIQFTWASTTPATPVDEILYDSIGESSFDATVAANNSNDNHICVGPSTTATFASLNLPELAEAFPPTLAMLFRPASPFTPFDCTSFTDGPIAAVVVEAP